MRRKTTALISCLLTFIALHAQNIPNGDFENWNNYSHYRLDSFYQYNYNVSRSTEHIEGRYALKLENTVSADGVTRRSGYCTNVIASKNQTGFPFEGDMLSVVFYAKYNLAVGDSARVYVVFYENKATKGYINFYLSGTSNGEFSRFNVPIYWYNTRTPDEVSIYLYSKHSPKGSPIAGNGYVIIDDLHFENIGKRGNDIYNQGFEGWTNDGIDYPEHWRSLDLLYLDTYYAYLSGDGVSRSTDAHGGNYSMKVSNYPGTSIPGRSYVYIGTTNKHQSTSIPSFKVYKRYNYLEGFFKYESPGKDSALIIYRMYKNGTPITYASRYLKPSNGWQYFNMKINYGSNDTIVPDSGSLFVYSSYPTPNHESSYLLLDDLDLAMQPNFSAIEEFDPKITVYPNPTNRSIYLNLEHPGKIELYNIQGQQVLHQHSSSGSHELDISMLPEGIYYLIFSNNDYQWKTKILKQ